MTASTPFTVTTTLAFEWIAITEIVVCVTPLDTDAVYAVVPDAKAGVNVTPLSESALSVTSADPARVTTRARQLEQFS